MINGMTLMLYVKNVRRAMNFWTAIGFDELATIPLENSMSVLLSGYDFGNVSIQLYEIDYIERTNPGIQTINANILFSTDDIDKAYEEISKETKRVSEIMPLGEDYTFSFFDLDGNQFAVSGQRLTHGLTDEMIGGYFNALKNAQLISARDLDFLPESSLVFFGKVTDLDSRELAAELSAVKLYYVDMENLKLSPDLQLICRRYEITGAPVLLKRWSDRVEKFDKEKEPLEKFISKRI
ncbi:MAG: hypothetical protein LBI11_02650 [Streptococcaceae bacterium]|jgi:lactoylglutathione lyase|nr:hypothetical protein [Streptococcaceae bacterium]